MLFICTYPVTSEELSLTLSGNVTQGDYGNINLLSNDEVPQFLADNIVLTQNEDAFLETGSLVIGSLSGDMEGSFTLRLATFLLTTDNNSHEGDGYSVGTFSLADTDGHGFSGIIVADINDFLNLSGYLAGFPGYATGYFQEKAYPSG